MAHFRENNIQNLLNAMLYFKDKSISTNITKFLESGCLDTRCQDKLHVTFQFLTNFNYFELCQQIDLLHHLILQLQYFWAYFYSSSFETTASISIFCCIWSEQKRSIATIMDKNSWDTPRKRPVSLNAWVFQSQIFTFRPPLPFSML